MKKFVLIVIACLIVTMFTGCWGSGSSGSSKTYSSFSEYARDTDPETYGYIQGRWDALTGQ